MKNLTREPKVVLELPPSENNTRNSEGDFIRLKNGNLLYVYTHYKSGSGADHDPAVLASRYSTDHGETWSDKDVVVVQNEGEQNVMSVSLLRLKNGDIALFYLRKNSVTDCIPYMQISKDEAKTWSLPVRCIPDKNGYFTLNNDRAIQLDNGRLLLPVSHFNNTDEKFDPKGMLYCYFSDDNGDTWQSSEIVPNEANILVQEPGLIELHDGNIMMYARSDNGKQQVSYSADQGKTWSAIESSNISSPLSPASIKKDPRSNAWIMVWNNNDGSHAETAGKRTPLTLAVSMDEGKSWEKLRDIETDKEGWYCYTAIYIDKKNILLSYCSGNTAQGTGLEFTTLTKFSKSWLFN